MDENLLMSQPFTVAEDSALFTLRYQVRVKGFKLKEGFSLPPVLDQVLMGIELREASQGLLLQQPIKLLVRDMVSRSGDSLLVGGTLEIPLSGYQGQVLYMAVHTPRDSGSYPYVTEIYRYNGSLGKLGGELPGSQKSGSPAGQPLADEFRLYQNYPNPFNPDTEIRFRLPEDGPVTLAIYNLRGQRIRTLVNGEKPAGFHSVRWDGYDEKGQEVAGGVYFCRLEAEGYTGTIKLLLLR